MIGAPTSVYEDRDHNTGSYESTGTLEYRRGQAELRRSVSSVREGCRIDAQDKY